MITDLEVNKRALLALEPLTLDCDWRHSLPTLVAGSPAGGHPLVRASRLSPRIALYFLNEVQNCGT